MASVWCTATSTHQGRCPTERFGYLPPQTFGLGEKGLEPSATVEKAVEGSSCHTLMSLPIRYSPMAFYFRFSIIFLTPQVLRHLLRRHDLLRPSREPSPSSPTIPYTHRTIGPVPHWRPLIWPMDHIVTFPIFSFFSLPDAFFRSPTNRRTSHRTIGTLPYVSPHTNLVLILLIICI